MKIVDTLRFFAVAVATLFAASCGKSEAPLRLDGVYGEMALTFPHAAYGYAIKGGSGEYSVKSYNSSMLEVSVYGSMLTVVTLAEGNTEIVIADGAGHTLSVPVSIKAQRQRMVVQKLYSRATGEKLDPADKSTIEARAEETIPVAPGGGFDFVFTHYDDDSGSPAGTVTIYPEEYGSDGVEVPFVQVKVVQETGSYTYFRFEAGGRMRTYVISSFNGVRAEIAEMAFTEDLTWMFEDDYPDLENVYSQMSLSQAEY